MSNDPNNSNRNADRPREPSPRPRPAAPGASGASGTSPPRTNSPVSKPSDGTGRVASGSSSGGTSSTGSSSGAAPARPARPQTPIRPTTDQRLEGVLETPQNENIQSIDTVIPSGLSTSTYLPSARRNPELERRLLLKRQFRFRQTVIPSAIVLCVSTLIMAAGWFLLDPTSALRDNPLGVTLPAALILLSIAFGIIAALLITQARTLSGKIEPIDGN